jgi:hypothetical protein
MHPIQAAYVIKLETECGATIWRGFFGKNANGDHDECYHVTTIEIEEEELAEWDRADDGKGYHIYSVRCEGCGILMEWPQAWYVVEEESSDS